MLNRGGCGNSSTLPLTALSSLDSPVRYTLHIRLSQVLVCEVHSERLWQLNKLAM